MTWLSADWEGRGGLAVTACGRKCLTGQKITPGDWTVFNRVKQGQAAQKEAGEISGRVMPQDKGRNLDFEIRQ